MLSGQRSFAPTHVFCIQNAQNFMRNSNLLKIEKLNNPPPLHVAGVWVQNHPETPPMGLPLRLQRWMGGVSLKHNAETVMKDATKPQRVTVRHMFARIAARRLNCTMSHHPTS